MKATNVLYLTNVCTIAADDSSTNTVWFVQITAKFDYFETVTNNHAVSNGPKHIIIHFLEHGNYQITRNKCRLGHKRKTVFCRKFLVYIHL